ncbi:MAG: hypothetical protein ACQERS_10550 [Bacteroidota bacterium]
MKKFNIYIIMLLLSAVAVSCFEENEFQIPDDMAWVGFEESSIRLKEDSGLGLSVNILISSAPPDQDLTINYSVSSDDATEGVDYELPAGSGTVVIPSGSNSVEVLLIESVINNENITGDRLVVFEITDADGFNLGGPDGEYGEVLYVHLLEDDFTIFGYSSFEDVDITGCWEWYYKPGGPDPELVNNYGDGDPDDAPVDFTATGDELGFDSSFDPTDVGDDGWEIMGVTDGDFSGWDRGVYPIEYGTQAYAASDLDGTLEIVFDEVTVPGDAQLLVLDMAVYAAFLDGGNYDENEFVELVWRTSQGDEAVTGIIKLENDGFATYNSGNFVGYDQWIHLSGNVSAPSTGRPVVRIKNDNNDDLTFVDNIVVKGF